MSERQLHKFGGSSLADETCFRRVIDILAKYSHSDDLVVVSAAGSTTNQLIDFLKQSEKDGRLAHETLMGLRQFQQGLIESLITEPEALVNALHDDCRQIAQWGEAPSLDLPTRGKVQGFGEVWSVRLLTALLNQEALPAVGVDSRQLLRAEHAAQPEVDSAKSWPLVKQELAQHAHHRVVITGFMAQNEQGETVLLGRNGSDYSATILGALAEVDRVTIWSDVAGVYSADPRKVNDACLLPLLRLDEANELARLAAPVLHSRTLQPVSQSALDLTLRCSLQPESGSTRVERVLASGRGAKIVTSLCEVSLLELTIGRSHDFAIASHEIESYLQRHQLQPLASFASEDKCLIQLAYTDEVVNSVMSALQEASLSAEIRLREGFSLVAAVGAGVINNPVHCHGFMQQLKALPVEFVAESELALSLAAVVRGELPDDLLSNLHATLFQAQKRVGVVLCGNGNIGSRWLELFARQQEILSRRHGKRFTLVAVVDSKLAWIDGEGIEPERAVAHFDEEAQVYQSRTLFSDLAELDYDELIVLDVTASSALAARYPEIAEQGMHLISANKVAGSAPQAFYQDVQDAFAKTGRHWLYNATVGAGLPINHTVRDLMDSGDRIVALSGIFSGTLSWLFEQFDGSLPFTDLVEQAWQQGLTEPDPRADLDGSDVMRKLVILAREAGLNLEPEQVKVESLVPDALQDVHIDSFFESADVLNQELAERLARAKRDGNVLRYVARLGKDGKARVGVESLSEYDALANLLPCDNIFAIESDWYKDNPLVIRGPGAGRDVTAGALQSDLNRLASML
ncbi:bifunctional aspartate kinase/homoserine dehydrogenase II [Thaumasiovibrio subtropicus]|uniref:bifunctional aspartate kinase/homoserine dehydrogenase II n=1 Tax=Thaumasiovibrio subtropicus TaxID=1891207 RepID=UPI000B35F579|nr:bifunctional aspartate kinase/homoserine dehydrogenase II [Thaumasiovibrio subtropicus]